MKKVLHLIKEYRGNYPLQNEYIKGLPPERYASVVCYLSGTPDGKNTLDTVVSLVHYLQYDKKKIKYFNPGVIWKIYHLITSEKIDIVHCHKHKAIVIGTIAATLAGVSNIIAHIHGLNRTRSLKRRLTNWILYRYVTKIITVSDSVRKDVIDRNWNLNPIKVVTVKNCINLDLIDRVKATKKDVRVSLGIPENDIVIGTVGRLVATKGHLYLLEAFSQVSKKIPNIRLLFIGEGYLSKQLRKKAEDLGILSRVTFLGYRDNVFELLRGFDIFVFPSIAEGLSIALLEAMASRLPIIASNVGGIPEVFGNTNCGRLIPAKNVTALFSAMLDFCLSDEDQRRLLGENGRRRVEKEFTSDIMKRNLSKVYELLSG
jgi:glycosyltransferase involved in cell wall biosynthesis